MKKRHDAKYKYAMYYTLNGEKFTIPANITIYNPSPFAGKGTNKIFDFASVYSNKYGGKSKEWAKYKGIAYVNGHKLEIHWVQHNIIGKFRGKVKSVKLLTFFLCLFLLI